MAGIEQSYFIDIAESADYSLDINIRDTSRPFINDKNSLQEILEIGFNYGDINQLILSNPIAFVSMGEIIIKLLNRYKRNRL